MRTAGVGEDETCGNYWPASEYTYEAEAKPQNPISELPQGFGLHKSNPLDGYVFFEVTLGVLSEDFPGGYA